jgi:hypothetical protein
MSQRSVLPVPGWLLAADFLSAALLAVGLLLHFDPRMAVDAGLPAGIGLVIAIFGGLGLAACAVAIVRHLIQRRAAASRLPH